MPYYKKCEACGANLDPGEQCNCMKKEAETKLVSNGKKEVANMQKQVMIPAELVACILEIHADMGELFMEGMLDEEIMELIESLYDRMCELISEFNRAQDKEKLTSATPASNQM